MRSGNVYSLERLIKIAVGLSAEKDFDILMKKILLEAMDVCGCDAGTVYVKENDRLEFHTVYTKSKGVPASEQSRNADLPPVPLDRSHVCACAAIDNKKINIPDIYESTEYNFAGAQKYDAINDYRTGSMLVIPMCDEKGQIIGVLQLINALDDKGSIIPFDPEYEDVISALASLAAVSLNNHQLANEVTELLHSFVRVMVDAIEARSAYNATHTRSMVKYAKAFIEWLDSTDAAWRIADEKKDAFLMSVWLHDIGKLVIPLEVLDKPDRLAGMKKDIESRIRIACLKEKIRSYEDPLAKDECEGRIRSIKEAWEDIKSANDAPFLDDERISRLNGYADIKCLDADDNEVPLLGDEELQAITVKKGTLTASERKTVESHVVYTSRMLSQMNFKGIYKEVPFWAGAHHEFLDGSGYPERLGENDLPNEARLLTIIDIYDALTAEDRPYKPPMEPQKAFGILKSMSEEGKLDGQILDMFIESKAWVRS